MKLKNVSYLERNFEKYLAGAAVLVIGVATYYYVLNTPNTVTLDKQVVGPGQVDDLVLNRAQRLSAQLSSNNVADALNKLKVPDYTANFSDKLKQPPAPTEPYQVAFGSTSYTNGTGPQNPNVLPYWEPKIPTPTLVAERADLGAIDPAEVQSNPDLAKILPDKAPYDTEWVSTVGQFDMKAMVKELTKAEDDQHQAIRPAWWQKTFAIVDVELARQQQNDDGSWPADDQFTIVKPMPGQVSFRDIPNPIPAGKATDYLNAIVQNRSAIIQPPFYELVGQPWAAPQPAPEGGPTAGDKQTQMHDLEHQIRLKMARIKVIDRQLQRMQQAQQHSGARGGTAPPPELPGVSGEFGPAGGEGLAPPPGGRRPTPRPAAGQTLMQRRVSRFNEQRQQLVDEVKKLQLQYQQLVTPDQRGNNNGGRTPAPGPRGVGTPYPGGPGGEFAPPGPGGPIEPGFDEFGPGGPGGEFAPPGPDGRAMAGGPTGNRALDVLNAETIDLWASDMNVQPGKTYRYKMRITVVNTLYNKSTMPPQQKKANADKFVVDSDWSAWGKPVHVQRMQHFYVLSASPQPAPGQANVEIYKFVAGGWRRQEFTIHPGDTIGGPVSINVPAAALGSDDHAAAPTPNLAGRGGAADDGTPMMIDFSTGDYAVDIDFDYVIKSQFGNLAKKTQVLMLIHDGKFTTRRIDLDKNDPERQKLMDEINGPTDFSKEAAGGLAPGGAPTRFTSTARGSQLP